MSSNTGSQKKFSLILSPFDQVNAKLLKDVKAYLLTDLNLQIYQIQGILENLPVAIYSSNNLDEITAKAEKLKNIGAEAEISFGYEAQSSSKSAVGTVPKATSEDRTEPESGLETAEKEEDDELIAEILEEEEGNSQAGSEQADHDIEHIYQPELDPSLRGKWQRFHSRNSNILNPISEVLPFILIGAIVLLLTNSLLFTRQEDPVEKLQSLQQELQKKRSQEQIAKQLYYAFEEQNEAGNFTSHIYRHGNILLSSYVSLSFNQTSDPNPDDILLGRNIPVLVKEVLIDSNVNTKIKDESFTLKTLAKVEVERAYQRFLNYFDVELTGTFADNNEVAQLKITIGNTNRPIDNNEVTWAEISEDNSINVAIKKALTLQKTTPPKKNKKGKVRKSAAAEADEADDKDEDK